MRQCALICLLAHTGSWVPARAARIGPIDRIFTRIGASDDLARGQSTFMVEMTESALILRNATAESLVLMDEVGRGTSTFDGLALAWACAEHLSSVNRAWCLFATHYFELTRLADEHDGIDNVHLDAVEHEGRIVFMHRIKHGATNRSYGLQVAELAGLPRAALDIARARLADLEFASGTAHDVTPGPSQSDEAPVEPRSAGAQSTQDKNGGRVEKATSTGDATAASGRRSAATLPQLDLFAGSGELDRYIADLDLDSTTPRDALEHLYAMAALSTS